MACGRRRRGLSAPAGFLGLPNRVRVSWTGQFGTSYDAETGRVTADLTRTCGSNGARALELGPSLPS